MHRTDVRLRTRRGLRPKLAEVRLDQAIVLAPTSRLLGAQHARLEGVHACGVVQHQGNHSASHGVGHAVKREGTYRFCEPVRPLGCEARHVRSNFPQLLAAVEHVMCFWFHAAKVKFAERLVAPGT